jgi:Ni,Fe-hydrogenase I cytochrome b subunit
VVSLPNLRLIHFFLMFVFISFGVFHVHLAMLISREEKKGLMDSIFIGYKVIPTAELEDEERKAAAEKA